MAGTAWTTAPAIVKRTRDRKKCATTRHRRHRRLHARRPISRPHTTVTSHRAVLSGPFTVTIRPFPTLLQKMKKNPPLMSLMAIELF